MSLDSRAIAKVFNSSVLNEISNGNFSYVEKIASKYFCSDDQISLRDFYQHAFSYLQNHYQNEYYYKSLIVKKILLGRHSLNTATMLTEFRVGVNKADCVILNGKSTCYEIKTDYDSLVRLADQLESYTQLFDEVYVVCSSKFQQAVLELAPFGVGILELSERCTLKMVRKAQNRTNPINKTLLMQSLRQHEYKELAELLTGEQINLPNTLLYHGCLSVIESVADDKTLSNKYIKILKKSRKNNDRLINNLPNSLANAAISYRFRKSEMDALIKYFNNNEGLYVLSDLERETQ
ncbi:hypothetical protein F885_03774 [Acinetobacter higginsii]|uniref:sce7726 family protein n=1 Tax=Acinetobacter higginsii TaxID=70347 RepID=UPI0002CF0427|nr:sce7726 family protein [Acinetobacter higginsii]ENX56398.1 hypothetical protein F885_03774 [Acinetobacter higginsii]